MTFALAGVRAVHLASLMILFGSAMLLWRLRARLPELGLESAGLRQLRLGAAALAFLSVLPAMVQGPGALRPWLAGGLIVLALLCGAVLARRELGTALLAGIALTLVSRTSHAAAASPAHFAGVGIATDALHLLCGGFWLGGLCVLATLLAQRRAAPRLADAVRLFAQWAVVAVSVLALTGLLNAASILLNGPGHASARYLGVLGSKLVLVLAMILLALNNFHLLPRLARREAAATLRGNIAWELALGFCAVALASLLGLLPPTV